MTTPSPKNPTKSAKPSGGRRQRPNPRFWHCPDCDAVVAVQIKGEHSCPALIISDSSGRSTETPLDRFFLSYPSFEYDRTLSPAVSYKKLQRQQGWRRDTPESSEAWDEYQRALSEEFQLWYSAEDDLGAWHALCRAIRIKPLPETCPKCKKAVRNRHVNLVDLIEWGRNGGESGTKKVRIFKSVDELRNYSRETGKIFRNDLDDDEQEGGVILRHLLRRLFNKRPSQK